MMGPSHAMSGAAAWLGFTAVLANTGSEIIPQLVPGNESYIPALVVGTAVAAGAALAPDIDSYGSTVVRSFGFLGRGLYWIANSLSLAATNIFKTRKDTPKENGHRTLFHTTLFAILAGLLVSALTSSTEISSWFGGNYTIGQISALIIMGIFLHLGLGGLFVKPIAKARGKYGPYIMMVVTAGLTLITAMFIPNGSSQESYAWLGIAVGFGWFMHLMGDFITKMGVPLLFPIPWKGRLWWNFATPSFMRLQAGGTVENILLLPLFSIATVALGTWHVLSLSGIIK